MYKLIPLLLFVFVMVSFSCSSQNEEIADNPSTESTSDFEKETHHPFLIVKKEQFPDLREKAKTEPWKSMKRDAISRSLQGSKSEAYDLQVFIGAAALAYILDENNTQDHARRVRDAILNQYSEIKLKDGEGWGGVVPPMSSFFVAILALDIVYDALNAQEIAACEKLIAEQIFKINRRGSWADVRRGTHGTWDIYIGDRATPDDDYFNGIMAQTTEDGVSPVTNHYAWERLGGGDSRISKSGYMDVLEFTGIDTRYYNNERLRKFHRWLFGSSVNCSKEMAIFGDMLPTQAVNNDMLHRRVVNFDSEAAGYAAWFHKGQSAIGHILTYILPKSALPEPVVPTSKIYEDGGAFFREKADDPEGLHGVLYNIKSNDEWHTHNEVNGLALSGIGNRLLVNGGRLGEPTRAADLNNTLTIDGENHLSRLGGGINTGFITDALDFASGFSGPALAGSEHYRNLLLVHGKEMAQGYFVVFDEVETNSGKTIKNYLHPANETSVIEVVANQQYEAAIDHFQSEEGTKLTIFYVTPPQKVNIDRVPSAVPDRYPGYPDHNRLESTYPVGEDGRLSLITVMFPHSATHPKAVFKQTQGTDFQLTSIDHTGYDDYIFQASGQDEIQLDNHVVCAELALFRVSGDITDFWFVRKGTNFSTGAMGFESDVPITIFVKDKKGIIISPGATVRFTGKDMELMKFDLESEILSSGDGFIEVKLGPGRFNFN